MKKSAKAAVNVAMPATMIVATLIVVLVVLAVAFRQTLAVTLLNLYLHPDELQLNCLEFDVNRRLDVSIKQVCIEHPSFKFTARNLHWRRESNQLAVEFASVIYVSDTTSSTSRQVMALNLPDALPLLDIKRFEIHTDFTEQPLVLTITQSAEHRFEISSGWHASLELLNQQLRGEINWQLSDLEPLGFTLAIDGLEQATLKSAVKTSFNFDGQTLRSQSQVDIEYNAAVAACPIYMTGTGEIGLVADLLTDNAMADLSLFAVRGQWQDCPLQQEIPESLGFKELYVVFSEPLEFTPAALTMTGVRVSSLPANQAVSNQRTALNLQLDNVTYEFDNGASADFQLRFDRGYEWGLSSGGKISTQHEGLQLNADTKLNVVKLEYQGIVAENLSGNFSLTYDLATGVQAQGRATLKALQKQTLKTLGLETNFKLTGADLNQLEIELDNNIVQLSDNDIKLAAVTNHSTLALLDKNRIAGSGQSKISDIVFRGNSLDKATVTHKIKADIERQKTSSEHHLSLGNEFVLNARTDNQRARVDIDSQSLLKLDGWLVKLAPQLSVQAGHMAATIEIDLDSLQTQGAISLSNTNANFADIAIDELNYALDFSLDSDGLQLQPAQLSVKSMNVGVLIENIIATIAGQNGRLRAYDIRGDTLDGKFRLDNVWLDNAEQKSLLTIQDIDIARLVALEKQSGIEIAGHLAGQLPLVLVDGRVSIKDGHLYNQHDGSIVIKNNAAFDALKAQQPEISGQLALLEQLNFEKLESTVNVTSDGLLNLDIAIIGVNPIAGERVNFNYTHEENILVLLKALRLTDSITNEIEQRLAP